MSNILDINTTLKPTYDEWNNSHQCVGFVKGTQIQGLGIPYGSFGNGKDVTKNLVKNYGYVDLKGNLKRGCVVSLGATSTNSYGHVVMINDMDSTYVWVAEGNYNGTSAGEYRESYKQTIADFKKRNGGVVGTAIHPKWNTTSSTPPTKTVKGYSFNECSADNGVSFFDIEKYGSTQDDLCFNIENLHPLNNGVYKLLKDQNGYVKNTQFRKIKTTFYTDGTKSTGSSSSSSIKTYRRTHGSDQGYYKIDSKYMNNLTVKGTTSDKYSCKYSTDNKTWMDTKVVGTTTMDYIV